MAGAKTKTSVTLDQNLFVRAENLSKKLHLSRSEFYSRAIEDLVCALEQRDLKERINAAQASLSAEARAEGQAVTEFLRAATVRTLQRNPEPDAW